VWLKSNTVSRVAGNLEESRPAAPYRSWGYRPTYGHRRGVNTLAIPLGWSGTFAVRRVMGVLAYRNRSRFRPTVRIPDQGPPKTRNRCSAWTPCIQQIPPP